MNVFLWNPLHYFLQMYQFLHITSFIKTMLQFHCFSFKKSANTRFSNTSSRKKKFYHHKCVTSIMIFIYILRVITIFAYRKMNKCKMATIIITTITFSHIELTQNCSKSGYFLSNHILVFIVRYPHKIQSNKISLK